MKQTINFVAAWKNAAGSYSVLAQASSNSLLALTGNGSSISRSCIHTFAAEKIGMLGLSAEELAKVDAATSKEAHKFATPIDVHALFGMDCKIQILEAAGIADALKLGILRKDKDGKIPYEEQARKRNKDKEVVIVNGQTVYRKTRLIALSDSPEAQDVLVSTVNENKPNNPNPLDTGAEEGEEEVPLF